MLTCYSIVACNYSFSVMGYPCYMYMTVLSLAGIKMAVRMKGFIMIVSVLALVCVAYLILESNHQTGIISHAPLTKDAIFESPIRSRSTAVVLQTQPTSSDTDLSPRKERRQLSRSSSASGPCSDSLCLEYLSKPERSDFDKCTSRGMYLLQRKLKSSALSNGTCHFVNGTGRRRVALASFPGSGNTWVRGLLEMTSGICTGDFLFVAVLCRNCVLFPCVF